MNPALARIQAAMERHETDLVMSLTLDEMQREIERGGNDDATTRRLRRRFLILTDPKTPELERAA